MSIKYTSHKAECDAAVDQAIARALEICGGTGERRVKDKITSNGSVVTGTLRRSIFHQPVDKYTMAVGTDVDYAIYVELGHHQQPGRFVPAIKKRLVASYVQGKPFLRPAMEQSHGEFTKIFQTELKEAGK